jgi:coenzyme F420-reducing hydrogenase alpha subunit
MNTMECDICGKHPSPKLGFHCATCARSAAYTLRLQHAETLLDKESLGKRVEAVIHGTQGGSQDSITLGGMLVDTSEAAKAATHERTLSDLEDARARIESIAERAIALRKEMEEQKKMIAAKKAAAKQRRSDAGSATHGLEGREKRLLDDLQDVIAKQDRKWQHDHRGTIRARTYLCKEAADLAGLKVRRVRRDGMTRQFYSIGGTEIFDLRSLNC